MPCFYIFLIEIFLQRVTHSVLAKGIINALQNERYVSIMPSNTCYHPIIQSGGVYCLQFNEPTNNQYLHDKFVVVSFGVQYNYYCAHLSRTLVFGDIFIIIYFRQPSFNGRKAFIGNRE